jgi:hypothetical protein
VDAMPVLVSRTDRGGRLRSREIEISVNGKRIDSTNIHDLCVIECEIPLAMTAAGEQVEITLNAPGAQTNARPSRAWVPREKADSHQLYRPARGSLRRSAFIVT